MKIRALIAIAAAALTSVSSNAQDLEATLETQRKQSDEEQELCKTIFDAAQFDYLGEQGRENDMDFRHVYVEDSSRRLVWLIDIYPTGSINPGFCKYSNIGSLFVERVKARERIASTQFKIKGDLLIKFHQDDKGQPVRRYVAGWRRGSKCGESVEWLLQQKGWYNTYVLLGRLANEERIFGTVDCYE